MKLITNQCVLYTGAGAAVLKAVRSSADKKLLDTTRSRRIMKESTLPWLDVRRSVVDMIT